jgi:hypothetical protein
VTQVGTNFVVTNTNDSGRGSLRQAILDANASAGDDLITFAIPGRGPHTITPATPLPAVEPTGDPLPDLGTLIIDATSQPGFAGRPVVELSGAIVGTGGDGLTIRSSSSIVRGLVINRFAAGIRLSPGPFLTTGNLVEGNYIGTDVTGKAGMGNSIGVLIDSADVFDNTIGGTVRAARNVISANGTGIEGFGGNTVQGNFIGTDARGAAALGNDRQGVRLFLSAAETPIGGSAPGARNIISGNRGDGVFVAEISSVLINNNFIGTDVSGARALGNGGDGIEVGPSLFTGGTISGNVISANGGNGVNGLDSFAAVSVLNNRVGTTRAGTRALGNLRTGVWFAGSEQAISGNVISGNREHGLVVNGLLNTIQGNRIGTAIGGRAALGNLGDGVRLLDRPNTVGAADGGPGNIIAFNGGDGVALAVDSGSSDDVTPILSNSIFSNGGLGIDLGDDGVTPNDACDGDTGANNRQNFPVIAAVERSASSTTVRGRLNSSPSAAYRLQFFASRAADPTGFGEGARLLGSTMVSTDSTCNATFAVTLPLAIAASHVVTATATDAFMSTSEFSNALAAVRGTPQEATRLLAGQVRNLVARGELNAGAGAVLAAKLHIAIFFMDREHLPAASGQLRGFIRLAQTLVTAGRLGAVQGRALADAANEIISGIVP